VITGAHVILYSRDPEADRAFLRDLLGLRSVELYLVCDDVDRTVADLAARGIAVLDAVTDQGWGRLTAIGLPGGGRVGLYEARHPTAFDA
jgi:catechol 2,3-dioxygenase-like lactoylglutathione lyase family enzyme